MGMMAKMGVMLDYGVRYSLSIGIYSINIILTIRFLIYGVT